MSTGAKRVNRFFENTVISSVLRLAFFVAFVTGACAQPQFEVASIKPSDSPDGSSSGITTTPGRISAQHVTVKRCIRGAYGIPEDQIVGGPKWIEEERYQSDAKAAGSAGDSELMVMLRGLLADRFHLVFHREQAMRTGYTLVAGKGGLKAKAAEPDAPSSTTSTRVSIDAKGCTMASLAGKLAEVLHVPVKNETGIEGKFNFKLEWAPEGKDTGPTIWTAVQEQLGLRLAGGKIPVDVIVIDSIARPTGN